MLRFVLITMGVGALIVEAVLVRGVLRAGPDGGIASGQYAAAAVLIALGTATAIAIYRIAHHLRHPNL